MKKKAKVVSEVSKMLVEQWHPTLNGGMTPDNTSIWYKKGIWWILPYDDPQTKKHFDFEWRATIQHRLEGNGCPYLTGKAVWPGFNDLESNNKELAAQWHPIKNGNKTPKDVTCGSGYYAWWVLPYDDPITGKHFDFEWQATVYKRHAGQGCPYLTGKK